MSKKGIILIQCQEGHEWRGDTDEDELGYVTPKPDECPKCGRSAHSWRKVTR